MSDELGTKMQEVPFQFWIDGLDMIALFLPTMIACFFALFAIHFLQQLRREPDEDDAPIAARPIGGPHLRPRWASRTSKYEPGPEFEPAASHTSSLGPQSTDSRRDLNE